MNEISRPGPALVPGIQGLRAEPEVGTVLAYRVQHESTLSTSLERPQQTAPVRTYHYASIRAGDGRWYTTGTRAEQGVDWVTLTNALRTTGAEVWCATGWAAFEL